jgi:imidazolonepropionase-like amidohydrolase
MRWTAVALSLLVVSRVGSGQTGPTTVVRAARMLDVTTGQMVPNAVVVVQGGKILSIGSPPPADAKLIDLGDATLLPGFIDLHTHLGVEISAASLIAPVTLTQADVAFAAADNARKTAAAGFTTVRDIGGDVTVALGKAVERGIAVGPHVIPSRNAIGITGGHCDATGWAPGILERDFQDGVADGPETVGRAVRYQIKHGAQFIKICATAGVLSLEGPVGAQQMSLEEMKAVVVEANRHGLRVAAHAHGTEGIKDAIRAGVTSIEHGSMLDDEAISLFKQHGTYLVPTTYLIDRINLSVLPPLMRSKAETIIPLARASLKKAIAGGVKIAFGTDAGVYPHGENAGEFAVYVKLGMSPIDAIRTATVVAAEALGKTDRGTIAVGKLADLVAVPGDPTRDITLTQKVSWAMVGGRVVPR